MSAEGQEQSIEPVARNGLGRGGGWHLHGIGIRRAVTGVIQVLMPCRLAI